MKAADCKAWGGGGAAQPEQSPIHGTEESSWQTKALGGGWAAVKN
jgi:hypothetical protein